VPLSLSLSLSQNAGYHITFPPSRARTHTLSRPGPISPYDWLFENVLAMVPSDKRGPTGASYRAKLMLGINFYAMHYKPDGSHDALRGDEVVSLLTGADGGSIKGAFEWDESTKEHSISFASSTSSTRRHYVYCPTPLVRYRVITFDHETTREREREREITFYTHTALFTYVQSSLQVDSSSPRSSVSAWESGRSGRVGRVSLRRSRSRKQVIKQPFWPV